MLTKKEVNTFSLDSFFDYYKQKYKGGKSHVRVDNLYAFSIEMSLEEVAKVLKITRERVRQIEAKALRKLEHPKRSKILKACFR